jgi:hypothetical protein
VAAFRNRHAVVSETCRSWWWIGSQVKIHFQRPLHWIGPRESLLLGVEAQEIPTYPLLAEGVDRLGANYLC